MLAIAGDELARHVADVATATLLATNWPGQGSCHDYALAASGGAKYYGYLVTAKDY